MRRQSQAFTENHRGAMGVNSRASVRDDGNHDRGSDCSRRRSGRDGSEHWDRRFVRDYPHGGGHGTPGSSRRLGERRCIQSLGASAHVRGWHRECACAPGVPFRGSSWIISASRLDVFFRPAGRVRRHYALGESVVARAAAALTATALILHGSPLGWVLVPVVPLLAWSRFALGRHNLWKLVWVSSLVSWPESLFT